MADATLEILIKAVDEMSATMRKIESNLEKTNKSIQKQTDNTGKAFTEATGNLLVLGNAASRVDSIFSSYTNMQIRVENATERVANAQDRLGDAQRDLERLQKSGTATADQLRDAEENLERASRGLTISQNNLERTQGQVIGTWINMGIQAIALVASVGSIITAINSLTAASIKFMLTPLGVALTALAVIVTVVALGLMSESRAHEAAKKTAEEHAKSVNELADAQRRANDERELWTKAIETAAEKAHAATNEKGSEELNLLSRIAEKKQSLAEIALGIENAKSVTELHLLQEKRDAEESSLSHLEKVYGARFKTTRDTQNAIIDASEASSKSEHGLISDTTLIWNAAHADRLKITKLWAEEVIKEYALVKAAADAMVESLSKVERLKAEAAAKAAQSNYRGYGAPGTPSTTTRYGSPIKGMQSGGFVEDTGIHLLHKGEYVTPANQTMKGGITINIENVYGVDERQISEALYERLRNTLTT